ncbi:hypothetical protein OC842_005300 [Tilletia horrida]|uniref:type II protein arginine methyltransferase n=1 Tax=Tilletia horrida TaxID=155126 RepID=A0AAN6G7L1_9BASI|nr:hypothetical protein OC842_005300 [Tilletia horrida]
MSSSAAAAAAAASAGAGVAVPHAGGSIRKAAALRSAALASNRASETLAANGPPFHRTRRFDRSSKQQQQQQQRTGASCGSSSKAASSPVARSASASASASALHEGEGFRGIVDEDGEYEEGYSGGAMARRSRAARFGSKRIGAVQVPKMMRWAVQEMVNVSNKHALRHDFLRVKQDARPEAPAGALTSHLGTRLPPARLALTHLAVSSPARFGVLYNVLSEVKRRLELPLPQSEGGGKEGDEGKEGQRGSDRMAAWSPTRVIEWNCAAAEGLWAAAEAFNDVGADPDFEVEDLNAGSADGAPSSSRPQFAGPLRAYEGYDDRLPLLRAGMEITAWAQSQDRKLSASSAVAQEVEEEVEEEAVAEEEEEDAVTNADEEAQDEDEAEPTTGTATATANAPWWDHASLEAISAAFRSAAGKEPIQPDVSSPFQLRQAAADEDQAAAEGGDDAHLGSRTLALSSFALSELPTDRDRQEHVRRMWKSGAEVIVIVDHATRRGFASVASARAFLLELGESTFVDPARTSSGQGAEIEIDESAERLVIGDHVFIADGAKATQVLEDDVADENDTTANREPIGAHVVAPCPHDRPCPLLNPFKPLESHLKQMPGARAPPAQNQLPVCSFSQRIEMPTYLRKTKHSKRGAEDIQYSYVVVRRGRRPIIEPVTAVHMEKQAAEGSLSVSAALLNDTSSVNESSGAGVTSFSVRELRDAASRTKAGILDILREGETTEPLRTLEEVPVEGDSEGGLEAAAEDNQDELLRILPQVLAAELEKEGAKLSEEEKAARLDAAMQTILSSQDGAKRAPRPPKVTSASDPSPSQEDSATTSFLFDEDAGAEGQGAREDPAADEAAMRLESYEWPRLIRPPLKKGGHVTFDACCASGAIERFTIPKSAGKQAYQDARKATWGDIFPHPPKNGKTSIRIPAASDELVEKSRPDEPDNSIPEHFDNLFELFATKSQLKQRALSGIDKGLGDVDHAAAMAPRRQKRIMRPSQAIGADIVAPTATQDRRTQKAKENKEMKRTRRTAHRRSLAEGSSRAAQDEAQSAPLSSGMGARMFSTGLGFSSTSGRRLFGTSAVMQARGNARKTSTPTAQTSTSHSVDKPVAKERHRTQYNYDIFAAQPSDELIQLPMVTAQDLAKSSTRPTSVRMLARDFIDDSLYNPHYGYFSRQAVLLPDHERLLADGGAMDGFAFEKFKNERHFMRHVEERYMHFESQFEKEEGKEEKQAADPAAAAAASSSDAAEAPKRRTPAPRMSSAEGLDAAKAIGRAWKAQQEKNSIQERDILAMAARQVWHTPTELFKPHYARAIARYIVAEYKLHHYPYDDLVIYELGAGSGALANDVLGYLAVEEPEVYARTRYNIVEISARLAEQQRQKLDRHFNAGRVQITNCSFLDWDTPVSEPAFVIALEVLDNLSHDVVRYSTSTLEPYQAVVSIDETNDMHELWEPVTDPLVARYLDLLEEVRPGQAPPPASHLRYIPAPLRGLLTEYMPLYPNLTPPHYIPTGQLRFLEVLRDYFPRHRLIVSDFDHLPDAIEGVDAPVVQTRYRGTMVPVTTYCVLQGFFDIFFPTDFDLMQDVYGLVMDGGGTSGRWTAQANAASPAAVASSRRRASPTSRLAHLGVLPGAESSGEAGPSASSSSLGSSFFFSAGMGMGGAHGQSFSQRRLRRPRLYSHAEFLERYAEVERTVLRDGTNPMVSWYANASFFLS